MKTLLSNFKAVQRSGTRVTRKALKTKCNASVEILGALCSYCELSDTLFGCLNLKISGKILWIEVLT